MSEKSASEWRKKPWARLFEDQRGKGLSPSGGKSRTQEGKWDIQNLLRGPQGPVGRVVIGNQLR